jgi:spermidine/putrescine transport system substrate-binding protein
MEPKEGRLSWVCGFVLMKDSPNYHHAHEYVNEWSSKFSAEWIEKNYAYGHANTTADLSKLDPSFVEVLHLKDPSALQEPKAHMDRYIARRKEYNRVWDEVKAA